MYEDRDPLQAATDTKDVAALRDAVNHISKRAAAPLLARLLLEDWHDSHEDIVVELGLIGDVCAIESIKTAVATPPDYIVKEGEWGNLHEFQRKCAYALARIESPESRSALEFLAQSADPHLRKYGEEGLEHWPMPYEGNQYA
jgi:hypothetical protein